MDNTALRVKSVSRESPVILADDCGEVRSVLSDALTTAEGSGHLSDALTTVERSGPLSDALTTAERSGPLSDALTTVERSGPLSDALTTAERSGPLSDALSITGSSNEERTSSAQWRWVPGVECQIRARSGPDQGRSGVL